MLFPAAAGDLADAAAAGDPDLFGAYVYVEVFEPLGLVHGTLNSC